MALPRFFDFNVADQNLSAYDNNWFDQLASINVLVIRSQHVECTAGGSFGNAISYWTGDSFTDDQQVVGTIGAPNYAGLTLRCRGSSGGGDAAGYLWLCTIGQVFTISAIGGFTSIATGWTLTSGGEQCQFTVAGDVFTGYINGTQAGTVTDTTYQTGGSPGIFASGANQSTIDDVTVDNFPSTARTQFNLVRL